MKTISDQLAEVHSILSQDGKRQAATVVIKAAHHMEMAQTSLERFLQERVLSPDAVEELEDIIKCLE